MNTFDKLSDNKLNQKIAQATSVLAEDFAAYGVGAAIVDLLDDTNTDFEEAISTAADLENQRRAAFARKQELRAASLSALSSLSGTIYANRSVDDAMLARIGFAPRNFTSRRTTPQQPQQLVATANADGSVKLEWNRNGNSRSTVFTVQSQKSGEAWANAGSTLSTKITLQGFTPGETVTFRVSASVNNRTSPASNSAIIYAPNATAPLSLAA